MVRRRPSLAKCLAPMSAIAALRLVIRERPSSQVVWLRSLPLSSWPGHMAVRGRSPSMSWSWRLSPWFLPIWRLRHDLYLWWRLALLATTDVSLRAHALVPTPVLGKCIRNGTLPLSLPTVTDLILRGAQGEGGIHLQAVYSLRSQAG